MKTITIDEIKECVGLCVSHNSVGNFEVIEDNIKSIKFKITLDYKTQGNEITLPKFLLTIWDCNGIKFLNVTANSKYLNKYQKKILGIMS